MIFRFLIFIFLILIFFSCIDNRAPSGISSILLYGEGDCMPPVNENSREYKLYNGKVYVVEKSLAESFNQNHYDTLKTLSLKTEAVNGGFSLFVSPGSYYVMPDTMFYVSPENLITIHPDDLIDREFRFFKCTSF